jgi:stage II sporulation protein R
MMLSGNDARSAKKPDALFLCSAVRWPKATWYMCMETGKQVNNSSTNEWHGGICVKKTIVAIVAGFMIAALFAALAGCFSGGEVNGEVFRLHILANSDSDADQKTKLYVRDKILDYMKNFEIESEEQAKNVIQSNLEEIQSIANQALAETGMEYGAQAEVGAFEFPARQYGEEFYPRENTRRCASAWVRLRGITGGV